MNVVLLAHCVEVKSAIFIARHVNEEIGNFLLGDIFDRFFVFRDRFEEKALFSATQLAVTLKTTKTVKVSPQQRQ